MDLRHYLAASLVVLTLVAAHVHGAGNVLPQTMIAVATACALDVALRSLLTGVTMFPIGAAISGLIVALLLSAGQPWYVPLVAASIAIGSKHLVRRRGRNVFNPAVAGIVAAVLLFSDRLQYGHADYLEGAPRIFYAQDVLGMDDWSFVLVDGHGWTGSTSAIAVVVLGAVLVHRLKRAELVAGYLATYVALFIGFAVATGQDLAIRLTLELFATGVLFFAFIMLTDPATSPRTAPGRMVYGVFTGVLSFGLRLLVSPVLFLLLALLVANLALALERERQHRARAHSAGAGQVDLGQVA